ncbi:formylglycine-generating enzyme family protein [Pendulispora brunnea]|uniref:Formylglycine-generating enzyme family protein n=1 Tax=Pendulispora brunnea TaxID=2905690 RepID=A0ABZ2KM40_9BACT
MAGGCAKGVANLEGGRGVPAAARIEPAQANVSHGNTAKAQKAAAGSPRLARSLLGRVGSAFAQNSTGSPTVLEQLLPEEDRPVAGGLCPPDMASIDDRFCIDRYEESLVEMLPNGEERPYSPYTALNGETVRAVSAAHVIPQAYISGTDAGAACARAGKRLCKPAEWQTACMGPQKTTYGYGNQRESRRCNDHGRSAMGVLYGYGAPNDRTFWSMDRMNNPMLNQVEGTLAKTGDHEACTNDYGVYDMVGNLHEWVADPAGTFQGGYYLDTQQNGDGCTYKTKAHEIWYHDYSTGFRCCADVAP